MKVKEKGKKYSAAGALFIAAFAVWTLLIRVVDVQAVGPGGSEAGFAALNSRFHSLTGVHMSVYTVTDWCGLIPIAVCLFFAGLGLFQMIRRKSLFKVDKDIILLGVYYVIVIFAYLIFEMIPVNYRPILIDGLLEASYPSSTTLLVLSVMPTLKYQIDRRSNRPALKKAINIFVICFSLFTVIGRLISGVHWFTDIAGGVLLSAGLFTFYKAAVILSAKEE